MKIYGSYPSPYVRRIRLLLADDKAEFINLNIYDMAQDRALLGKMGPIKKIPVLEVMNEKGEADYIWDSKLIYHYIQNQKGKYQFDLDEERLLCLVDALNDTFVNMFLLKRSGVDVNQETLYFNIQRERTTESFLALEQLAAKGRFNEWSYSSICLFCLIDWILFRELQELKAYPALMAFHQLHSKRADVQKTDPRLVS